MDNKIVYGKILEINSHPRSESLWITKINIGNATEKTIVTKATNIKEDNTVIIALPGSELISQGDSNLLFTVEEKEILGVKSEALICSSTELGLYFSNHGVYIDKSNNKRPGQIFDADKLNKHIHILKNLKVNTDEKAVDEFLNRGPEEIIGKDELREKMISGKPLRAYIGYDVSGPNLHLGNGSTMMKLRDWQELGHYTIVLIGDYTARVGDHSDKLEKRKRLTIKEIEKNKKLFEEQFGRLIDLDMAEVRFNSEWLEPLTFNDVIGLTSLFSIQQMIERENFALRLKEQKTIGMEEIMYPLMQGFDAYALDVDLQIGGTDQTFNMLAGRKIMKAFSREPLSVITMPLIPGTDGRKMSKSWNNYVAMSANEKDLYAGIMSCTDDVMFDYFKLLTRKPLEEIDKLTSNMKREDFNPMNIKKSLAFEITSLYFDNQKAQEAEEYFEHTVQNKETPEDIPTIKRSDFVEDIDPDGFLPLKSLLNSIKLAPSSSEAKRLVKSGAVEIDSIKQNDPNELIDINKISLIKVGKRKWIKIVD